MRKHLNNARGAAEKRNLILRRWPRWKKASKKPLPLCAAAVSELMFRDEGTRFKDYSALKIAPLNPTKKGTRRFEKSKKAKEKTAQRLIARYRKILDIGDAQWSLAALFMIGESYTDYIDSLLKAPIPNRLSDGYKLTSEDKATLRGQLASMTKPIEEQAVDAYRVCVDTANRLGVYNRWSVRASEALQKLRPVEYPKVEERLVALTFSREDAEERPGLVLWDSGRYARAMIVDSPKKEEVVKPTTTESSEKTSAVKKKESKQAVVKSKKTISKKRVKKKRRNKKRRRKR